MKTIFLAATAAFLLAAPAFAAEEYQSGPALVLSAQIPTSDTGSAQLPRFDGQHAVTSPRLDLVTGNSAEASVETVNSQSVALGTWHASIGLVAQR